MFLKEVSVNRAFKILLLLMFIVLTLFGGLFGAGMGVNYSHVKLAFYVLSIPSLLILIAIYFLRFKTQKLSYIHYSISLLLLFYTSIVGGGFIYLFNSIGVHQSIVVSGPVILKEQNEGKWKPSFYITFENNTLNEIVEIELTSYVYNQLEVGDIYTETMYVGSLGLLYRQKT
jgi:hypothetical protein